MSIRSMKHKGRRGRQTKKRNHRTVKRRLMGKNKRTRKGSGPIYSFIRDNVKKINRTFTDTDEKLINRLNKLPIPEKTRKRTWYSKRKIIVGSDNPLFRPLHHARNLIKKFGSHLDKSYLNDKVKYLDKYNELVNYENNVEENRIEKNIVSNYDAEIREIENMEKDKLQEKIYKEQNNLSTLIKQYNYLKTILDNIDNPKFDIPDIPFDNHTDKISNEPFDEKAKEELLKLLRTAEVTYNSIVEYQKNLQKIINTIEDKYRVYNPVSGRPENLEDVHKSRYFELKSRVEVLSIQYAMIDVYQNHIRNKLKIIAYLYDILQPKHGVDNIYPQNEENNEGVNPLNPLEKEPPSVQDTQQHSVVPVDPQQIGIVPVDEEQEGQL